MQASENHFGHRANDTRFQVKALRLSAVGPQFAWFERQAISFKQEAGSIGGLEQGWWAIYGVGCLRSQRASDKAQAYAVKSGMKSPLFRGLKRPLISGKNVRWTGGGGCFRIR